MSTQTDHDARLISDVRRRRTELRSSMAALERAVLAEAEVPARWAATFRDALEGLLGAFVRHVTDTEGPGGLYAELSQRSPRLISATLRLTEEHAEIDDRLEELLSAGELGDEAAYVVQARRSATELLVVLERHRQHGADLVFEAFDLDIGGED